jgi:purine-binding chemotaxis protein CheW
VSPSERRDGQDQYLTFFVREHELAAPILEVREIIELGTITLVPGTPPFLRGVLNLRGTVVPVLDLAVRFGQAPSVATTRTCIVVVEIAVSGEHVLVGLMADEVSQVLELRPEDVAPPPAFGSPVDAVFLKALGKRGSRFVLVLDLPRLLATPEVRSLARETASGALPARDPA